MAMTDKEFKDRSRALSERKIVEAETQRKLDNGKNIIVIVFGIILLACLIRVMTGNADKLPTFTGFLEVLTTAPTVEIPFLSNIVTTLGDWGLFNFLRDFLQVIISVFDVLIFLVNGILNIMAYVVYFMRWLFIG